MNMTNCPQCGKPRHGETFKCPDCDVFYSQLDELLFLERQREESRTLGGHLKAIWAAEDRKQAAMADLKAVWRDTPLKTKIALLTIFAFVFALVTGV